MIYWARLQECLKNFGSGKHSAKKYSAKTIEKILENLHKILKIFSKI